MKMTLFKGTTTTTTTVEESWYWCLVFELKENCWKKSIKKQGKIIISFMDRKSVYYSVNQINSISPALCGKLS